MLVSFISSRIRCNTATEATISRVIKKSTVWKGKTLCQYTPVFTYTVDNRKFSVKADSAVINPKRFIVGNSVNIYIDTKHPEVFRYGSNIGIVLGGLVLLTAGIIFIVCVRIA